MKQGRKDTEDDRIEGSMPGREFKPIPKVMCCNNIVRVVATDAHLSIKEKNDDNEMGE